MNAVNAQTHSTYCRICEAACGLRAEVGATGKVSRLRPDENHPISRGFICTKGLNFFEVSQHVERLQQPQMRGENGRFQTATWNNALHHCSQKLQHILDKHGPHAVGIYFGTPLIHNVMGIVSVFQLARAFGTRNLFTAGSQDNNNKLAASELMYGTAMIHPMMDIEHADLAILWGTNPLVTQSSFVHLEGGSTAYDRLLSRNGRIIIVDPRRTESANRWAKGPADHLPIRPGSDIYLLLALLHKLQPRYQPNPHVTGLDQLLAVATQYPPERAAPLTGIPAPQICQLAIDICQSPHTTFHLSIGVNQGPFGTLCYIAMQAIAYLSGNWDREGGLLYQPLAAWLDLLLSTQVGPTHSRIGHYPTVMDTTTCAVLADEILTPGDGQIRALIVVAGNPLVSIPGEAKLRQAFESLELLVSLDLFMNETGQLAHVVLPMTSWLERWDVASWQMTFQQNSLIQYAAPVQPPPGDVRTEAQVLAALSVGAKRPLFGNTVLARAWGHPGWNRFMPTLLDALFWWPRRKNGVRAIPWFKPKTGRFLERGSKTPEQQVRFWHSALALEPKRLAEYATQLEKGAEQNSFLLLGRRRRRGQNSWLHGGKRGGEPETAVWLNPEDMAQLGVQSGERVVLETAVSSLTLPVQTKPGIPKGQVVVPHGLPGHNINALHPNTTAYIEPVSGMYQLQGIPIQIRRAATK